MRGKTKRAIGSRRQNAGTVPEKRAAGPPPLPRTSAASAALGVCERAAEAVGEITRASTAARRARAHLVVYERSRPDGVGRRGGQHVRDRGGHGRERVRGGRRRRRAAEHAPRDERFRQRVRGELRGRRGAGAHDREGRGAPQAARALGARARDERGGRVGVLPLAALLPYLRRARGGVSARAARGASSLGLSLRFALALATSNGLHSAEPSAPVSAPAASAAPRPSPPGSAARSGEKRPRRRP